MAYTSIKDTDLIDIVHRFLSSNGVSSYTTVQIIYRLKDSLPFLNMDFGESFSYDDDGNFNKSMSDSLAAMLCIKTGVSILWTEAIEESKNAVKIKHGEQTVDLTRVAAAKREVAEMNEKKYDKLVKKTNWDLATGASMVLKHYGIAWD